jgi:hypothetical protein
MTITSYFDDIAADLMGLDDTTLRSMYSAYGHFYCWVSDEGEKYRCRSVLEIVRAGVARLLDRPDAIFVMMNPGGSTLIGETEIGLASWRPSEAPSLTGELLPTNPDDTQSQLMRIMASKGWEHVRVLNLSDLCESDSNEFYRYHPRFEASTRSRVHSIFSDDRRGELAMKLKRKPAAPVIVAWGVNDKLRYLVASCEDALKGITLIGYQNKKGRYYHPLYPRQFDRRRLKQQKWISVILSKLN